MQNPSPAKRLAHIKDRISEREAAAERSAGSVTLVTVSKTFAAEDIRPVIEAGQKVFGENRVQESQAKWPSLKDDFEDLELHLIGPLQSNKAKDAVALFDVIQTIDREKIARAVSDAARQLERSVRVFVQVNTGEEPQKAGISPAETHDFVNRCRNEHGLQVDGLMCIPPIDEEPALHFALLEKLGNAAGVSALSMGMSADFETAIDFGATHVRVGSAIFGARG